MSFYVIEPNEQAVYFSLYKQSADASIELYARQGDTESLLLEITKDGKLRLIKTDENNSPLTGITYNYGDVICMERN